MVKLSIKPISLNSAYRGRRFATAELKQFKVDMSRILPKLDIPKGRLAVHYIFGVSSKNCDGDNLAKATQDCLAECYGFNDRIIYKWVMEKVDVKKGEEYILFNISALPSS